jgi:hypothetical protein
MWASFGAQATLARPVLFLDIDDVVCLNLRVGGFDALDVVRGKHPDPSHVLQHLFASGACSVLHQLHETLDGRLRYVISSTWREYFSPEPLRMLFEQGGLPFVAAALEDADGWCTPKHLGAERRADEIAAWLDRHHKGEPFAIVDDMFSGASLLPALTLAKHPFHGRVVLCDRNVGLLDEHLPTLIKALMRPANLGGTRLSATDRSGPNL